jgi:hypothetical protein
MGRTKATEQARSRSKTVLIDEIARDVQQFRDILAAIEDFSREGFPYREAARAKAELQFRNCVRQSFGERSPEFQAHRNHKIRVGSQAEIAQSVTAIKTLIHALESKKLGLQQPALSSSSSSSSPTPAEPDAARPQMTLVPPLAPTAQLTVVQPQPHPAPPLTTSVAITTNLETPPAPGPAPSLQPNSPPATQASAEPMMTLVSAVSLSPSPSASEIHSAPAHEQQMSKSDSPVASASSAVPTEAASRSNNAQPQHDPIKLLRKVCLRFHAVVRQLRLRKDYRPTLEVEDIYDLQDVLCALLKMEFEEVGTDEWTPPYTDGTPRTTFLLDKDRIAFVAKKTRQGLTPKELADQVQADAAHYATRNNCNTVFCFIYDPEGRIGSPMRLETDLTSVSDRCIVDVLVAPK